MKTYLLYILTITNLLSMIHLGFFMVGANMYDIKQFRKNKRRQQHSAYQPLVSVIVPAHNETAGIRATLDSILASSYKNIEVLVVDDGSIDNTAEVVQRYIRKQGGKVMRSYNSRNPRDKGFTRHYTRAQLGSTHIKLIRQTNQGKAAAMNNAIEYYVRGELMMCLDADSKLEQHAVERAVRYFEEESIMGVAANVRVTGEMGWLTLLQRFEHMIGYRSKKFYTLSKAEFIIGGVASMYRTSIVKRNGMYDTDTQTEDIGLSMKLVAREGNRYNRIVYASDVVAMTGGVLTFRALLKQRYRWKLGSLQNLFKYRKLFLSDDSDKYTRRLTVYRLPMALLGEVLLLAGPLLLGFITYLSISRHTFGILLGAYLTVTLYTMWTIWPDEHLRNGEKLRLSLYGFFMYILFYAMDVVQFAAVCRCVWNYKQVVLRKATDTTWTSPARKTAVTS